jgi:hypothetical protein
VEHALRLAQYRVASEPGRTPKDWAAFELVGISNTTVSLTPSRFGRAATLRWWEWLVAVLLSVIFGFALMLKWRTLNRRADFNNQGSMS